jgi:hypothetical protein
MCAAAYRPVVGLLKLMATYQHGQLNDLTFTFSLRTLPPHSGAEGHAKYTLTRHGRRSYGSAHRGAFAD